MLGHIGSGMLRGPTQAPHSGLMRSRVCAFGLGPAGPVATFSLVSWPALRCPEPEHCLLSRAGPTSGGAKKEL